MDINHISNDIAIDFGSAMTRIFIRGRGLVLEEPSVIAYDTASGETVAVGLEAYLMTGRTPPGITVAFPVAHGIICEATLAEELLRLLLRKVCPKTLIKPRMTLCVPSGATGVEIRALRDAAVVVGARSVCITKAPLAAAIGVGIDVMSEHSRLLVDFGDGKCEIAVVGKGQIIYSYVCKNGAAAFDTALSDYLKEKFALSAGYVSIHGCKEEIGCVFSETPKSMRVRGVSLSTLCPMELEISSEQTAPALSQAADSFTEEVKAAIINMPSELLADVLEGGITLTGGGAKLCGLSERLRHSAEMKVTLPEESEHCVINGLAALCENPALLPKESAAHFNG